MYQRLLYFWKKQHLTLFKSNRLKPILLFIFLFWYSTLGYLYFEHAAKPDLGLKDAMWWALVTMTTVGYGDISPKTGFGQAVSAIIMIIGYAIIAVPTGIVTVELSHAFQKKLTTQACPTCSAEGHDSDAKHCKYCGARL